MNKKLLALVGGAGVAAGVLMAPDKGSKTIRKISNRGKKILDNVKKSAGGEIESVKKSIRNKMDEVKTAIRSKARAAADKTLEAEEKVHRKLRDAIRSARKAAGASEKKTSVRPMSTGASRNGAARKSVSAGKPSRLKKAVAARSSSSNGARRKSASFGSNGRTHAKKSSAR